MDPENAIEVKGLYKKFNVKTGNRKIKDFLVYRDKDKEYRWVLKDINVNVKKGEVLGIIGRNGSGKSTLLKILTKILKPNEGTVETKGRISCLIELGAGFHPDMTGRENTYINASIFGIDNKAIDKRFQDILDFSEIGDFIDERVRNYSSGMYMRLAFAIAINVDADIMLVDEILAVGDMQFQKKCINKLKEFRNSGGTIVLVTHNNQQAREMCDRVLWIDNGIVKGIGPADDICDEYENFMMNRNE